MERHLSDLTSSASVAVIYDLWHFEDVWEMILHDLLYHFVQNCTAAPGQSEDITQFTKLPTTRY